MLKLMTEAVCHDGVHATVRADLLRRDAGEHFYLSGTPGIRREVGPTEDLKGKQNGNHVFDL